jgi:hypothetical protein
MGLGVKEPKIVSGEHVPGTSLLVDIGRWECRACRPFELEARKRQEFRHYSCSSAFGLSQRPSGEGYCIRCAEEFKQTTLL